MTDIKTSANSKNPVGKALAADPETAAYRQGIELLFFAYRDFTARADQRLLHYGFGRAHHRVIYFVGRNPDIRVSELLSILKITKQSLNRVLGQLVRQGFIAQRPGTADKRQRLLSLTARGATLEQQLTEEQRALLARVYRECGAKAVEGFHKVLIALIEAPDRARFEQGGVAQSSTPKASTPKVGTPKAGILS